MKQVRILVLLLLCLALAGCAKQQDAAQARVTATTYPVAQFTEAVCEGTDIAVSRVISDAVSCLHDYSLSVDQMKAIAQADVVVLSGLGLEDFMEDALADAKSYIDASAGVPTHAGEDGTTDPHIWLSPENACIMVQNIADGLAERFPDKAETFQKNAEAYCQSLQQLQADGEALLSTLSCRELVTFHDGFSYFTSAFDLTILAAIEEESGAEASAKDLTEIINLVNAHALPAIFTEANGSTAAASVVSEETGCAVFALDMCMGDRPYLDAMRYNLETIAEALS